MFCPSHNIYCCCFNVLAFNKMLREKTFFWACLQNIHSYTFIYLGSISTFNMYLDIYSLDKHISRQCLITFYLTSRWWKMDGAQLSLNSSIHFSTIVKGCYIQINYNIPQYSRNYMSTNSLLTVGAAVSGVTRPRLQQTVWAAEFC